MKSHENLAEQTWMSDLDKAYGMATIAVRDCRGKTLKTETRELAAGAHVFEVPASGLLEVRRQP